VQTGPLASDHTYGNNGAFSLVRDGTPLFIVVSDGAGWEHASVHVIGQQRTPTWEEMCWVKDVFWPAEEEVVQYHPKRSEYVNCHPYTLHLWRPSSGEVMTPPPLLVGPGRAA